MSDRTDLGAWGRQCFLAGYVLFAVLDGLYRLLDWPDWVGVVVAVAVPMTALSLIERRAARRTPPR